MSERIPIQIYDDPDIASNNPVADLGEAKNIQYRKRRNEVWTASFDLPVDNEKNDHFDLLDFAEIYDGDKRVGLFRVDEREPVHSEDEEVIRYQCSHVLDTLNDDRLAITTKATKSGTSTALNYILGEQDTAHWQLGTLDFSQDYEYEFSRQTLLKALFDVPKPWWEDYRFTFDTTSYPWTLNLVIPDTTPKGSFRYSKNLQSIERTENAKDMINELYAFGEGSGDEQVSAGPFTSDPAGYGWNITDIWEEQFFDNQTDLANAAQRYLDRFDTPKVSYRGTAVDLRRLSDVNDFDLGDYIRIYDPILGIEDTVPVVEIAKNNVMGEPLRLEIELANRQRRFPEYGALAFKDEATEENLASGSVGGGALAGGGVGSTALADEAVTWSKFDTGLKNAAGEAIEGSRLSISAQTVFETDYNPQTQWPEDTLAPDAYKVRGETVIEGGYINTGLIEADSISVADILIDNDINMSESGINVITGCESIGNGTDVIYLTGGYVQAGSQILAANGIDMDTADIINPGNIDGVNLSFHASDVDAHHSKYTDSEAVSAIEAATFSANLDLGTNQINNLASANGTTSNAANFGDVIDEASAQISSHQSDVDAHHTRYQDSEVNDLITAGNALTKTWDSGVPEIELNVSEASISHDNIADVSEKDHQELLGGTDISVTYGTGQVTINFTGTANYTDEDAQDAVGNILDSDFNYDDAGNSISLATPYVTVAGNQVYLGASTSVAINDLDVNSNFDFGIYDVDANNITVDGTLYASDVQAGTTFDINGAALGGVEETIGGTLDGTGYDGYLNINGHIVGYYN